MSQIRRMIAAMPEKTVISDYVQDGLVLAYDGYQAPSGGVWKDLSPSHNDLALADGYNFDTDNHRLWAKQGDNHTTTDDVYIPTNFTWEIVLGFPEALSYNTPLSDGKIGLVLKNGSTYFRTQSAGYVSIVYMTSNDFDVSAMQVAYDTESCESRFYRNSWAKWSMEAGYLNHKAVTMPLYMGPSSFHCSAYIYALRIYNRKLTDAELLHNRKLDAARFDIPTTKIDQV